MLTLLAGPILANFHDCLYLNYLDGRQLGLVLGGVHCLPKIQFTVLFVYEDKKALLVTFIVRSTLTRGAIYSLTGLCLLFDCFSWLIVMESLLLIFFSGFTIFSANESCVADSQFPEKKK